MNGFHDVAVQGLSWILVGGLGYAINLLRKQSTQMNTIENIQQQLKDMHLDIMRNQILTLIYDDPHSHAEILDLFYEYEKLGGNGSTKARVEEWKKRENIPGFED